MSKVNWDNVRFLEGKLKEVRKARRTALTKLERLHQSQVNDLVTNKPRVQTGRYQSAQAKQVGGS
jgi:hypothetical protein